MKAQSPVPGPDLDSHTISECIPMPCTLGAFHAFHFVPSGIQYQPHLGKKAMGPQRGEMSWSGPRASRLVYPTQAPCFLAGRY